MSDYLRQDLLKRKKGIADNEPVAASTVPQDSLSANIARRRAAKKDKGYQKVYDFYLKPEEQKEIIQKETSTTEDIIDFIDNINRVFYGVAGAAHEAIKSYKYDDDSLVKGISDTGKAFYKGFTREEKKTVRDVAMVLAPNEIKEIEEKTNFELFWGIEANVLSPIFFVADIAIDPLTYVPFGLPAKLAKNGLSKLGKSGKVIAESVIGAEKVAKITESSQKFLVNKVWPYFNIKKVFENVTPTKGSKKGMKIAVDDLLETFTQQIEAAPTISVKKTEKALKTGERVGLLSKINTVLDEDNAVKLGDFLHKMNDEGIKVFEEMFAKRLGINADDVAKMNSIDDMLGELIELDNLKKINELDPQGIKRLKEVKDKISGGIQGLKADKAKIISKKLIEQKGFKKFANDIAKVEKDATISFAKSRLDLSKSLWKETTNAIQDELKNLKTAAKSNIKLTNRLLTEEASASIDIVKKLEKAISSTSVDAADDLSKAGLEALDVAARKISRLNDYQTEILKGLKKPAVKSQIKARDLLKTIKDTQIDLASIQKASTREAKQAAMLAAKDSISKIKRVSSEYRKLSSDVMKEVKRNIKLTGKAQQDIVKKLGDDVATLTKKKSDIDKFYRGEIAAKEIAVLKAEKMSVRQANKYYKAFSSLNKGKAYQQFLKEFQSVKTDIFEKGLQDLPDELHGAARKVRQLLDDYAVRLSSIDDPAMKIIRGTSPLYAPRIVQREFMEQVSRSLPEFRSSKTFTNSRKFKYYKEFKEYIESQGGKVENDAVLMVMDYAKKAEMAYAKKNFETSLVTRLGLKNAADLPKSIKDSIKYMYSDGISVVNNPMMRMLGDMYGRTLNTTKAILTVMNPAFHVRNIMGFPFLSSTTAGLKHGLNPMNYADALLIKQGRKGFVKGISYDAIREAAEQTGYFGASFMRGDLKTAGALALNRRIKNPFKKFAAELFKFSMHTEDLGRYGALVANLKAGKPMDDALKLAKQAMFDYNLINSPADKMMQSILGFYTFTRKNLPQQLWAVFNDPKQYAIMNKAMMRISNREELSDEEINLLNGFEKETFKIFGDSIDGIREFHHLGFMPAEEAYTTLNALTSGDIRKVFGGRVSPLLGSFLDWYYGKSSFYQTDFGTYLSPKYANIIPEPLQKLLGLTARKKNKYRGGEVVGQETALYGDPDTIFMIRNIPLTSRFINDIANLTQSIKEGKAMQGATRYLTGIRANEIDRESRERFQKYRIRKALTEKAKTKGAKMYERPYIPKEQRK